MARKIKQSEILTSEHFFIDNAFVNWYARYFVNNACTYEEKVTDKGTAINIYFSDLASMRFAIGIDETDFSTVLGIAEDSTDAFQAFNWEKVSFLRRVKGKSNKEVVIRDWVVFSANDIRNKESGAPDPISLKIWLPAISGILDGWIMDNKPSIIKIINTRFIKGEPKPVSETPIETLKLTFHGNWQTIRQ